MGVQRQCVVSDLVLCLQIRASFPDAYRLVNVAQAPADAEIQKVRLLCCGVLLNVELLSVACVCNFCPFSVTSLSWVLAQGC